MLSDWKELFDSIKDQEYSKSLRVFLDAEYSVRTIYPPRDMVFQAFKLTNPLNLKVVIIGQDPYHSPGQAMGMSFSVPRGIDPPPSLINVYKEIESDLKIKMNSENGDLTPWAQQGVLLLNAYLTVRSGIPLSHRRPEYDEFIHDVMIYLDKLQQPIVFMLWGTFAKKFIPVITNPKHLILTASHPSPMAANYGGWFGNKHFSQCNEYLLKNNIVPIDWQIK
jgi:uracil-DNA glycosylase